MIKAKIHQAGRLPATASVVLSDEYSSMQSAFTKLEIKYKESQRRNVELSCMVENLREELEKLGEACTP